MFTSYAQNFEDVMLWRALKHVEKGFYIDVGAQHPVIDSVSMAFYEHNWRGVHVEPNPHDAQLLRENRPDETVIQAAVSGKGTALTFYEIIDTGLSTCDAKIAERHRASGYTVHEITIPSVTLANVFESCDDRDIHWLKIDVEGMEEQVLQGWKPSKARPWIVILESTLPLTQIESHEKWEGLIIDLDYQFVYFDGLNRFYVSNRHPELKGAFRASPNVFDDFALSGTSSAPFSRLLNDRLANLEQEMYSQVALRDVEILRRDEELGKQIAAWEKDRFENNRYIESLQEQVTAREKDEIEKERYIESLKENILEKDRQYLFTQQTLKDRLDEKDRNIGTLKEQIAAKEKDGIEKEIHIESLQDDILKKERHIESLEEDMLKKERHFESLKDDILKKDQQHLLTQQALNDRLDEKDRNMELLRSELNLIKQRLSYRLLEKLSIKRK